MEASAKSLAHRASTALRRGGHVPLRAGRIYGAGAEVVCYGFLLLLAGVPVFVWVRWRALVPAGAITVGSGGAR